VLPELLVAADSVRRLSVAIVLLTSSFNKTLTTLDIERVHEEVAEFHAFYQEHGAGKIDFDFALVQVDRRLARREIAEVLPGRHYLSRDDLQAELTARGFRGRFDEVIALHAWSNADPDRAVQAYGGGAVGPDGNFLGDAGFNSIPVMGRDPNTIGQVLIHEVLHNLDDMFSRSGMPDDFLNSDEMSRNMPQLLRERPGAFLPRYTDAEMLDYAERERQGREAYPWAMQLVYYGWMLERTPKAAWDRLRYGRMVVPVAGPTRPLYSTIYTSAANDAVYLVELGASRLPARTFTQADFDGTPIFTGTFHASWMPVPDRYDTVRVGSTRVVRQRVASIVVAPEVTAYAEQGITPPPVRVLRDRCCGDGPPLAGAEARLEFPRAAELGTFELRWTADVPGWYVHPGAARLTARRSWSVTSDGPVTTPLGSPVTINAFVREDRGRDDVTVTGTVAGHALAFTRTGDGRYSATVADELPFGLHHARLEAREVGGTTVTDSVRVYVRPAGWIQVPDRVQRGPGGRVAVTARLWSRMGVAVRQPLPLVAVVGDEVTPLRWRAADATYTAAIAMPPGADRLVLTSLVGDPQRRVVLVDTGAAPAAAPGTVQGQPIAVPPFATAARVPGIIVDGDLGDWPPAVAAVSIGPASHILTDPAVYHGASDLAGQVRFAWNDSTLYVGGAFADDSVTIGEAWDTDRVNLVFDMKDDTSPVTYRGANPPLNEWQDDDYWLFWRMGGTTVRRFGTVNADPVPGARLATRRTACGWAFEAAIPRSQLPGYLPFTGQVAGLQVFVTDGDGEATATELMWSARWPYSADGIAWRLAELAHLLFVDAPLR
jgi:hypothetical protein